MRLGYTSATKNCDSYAKIKSCTSGAHHNYMQVLTDWFLWLFIYTVVLFPWLSTTTVTYDCTCDQYDY